MNVDNFSCEPFVDSSNGIMEISWYRNSQTLRESDQIEISQSQTSIRNVIKIILLSNKKRTLKVCGTVVGRFWSN